MPVTLTILNALCDEVAAAVNAAELGAFTAVRVKRPRFELAEAEGMLVQVYPAMIRHERTGRSDWQSDYAVCVGVVQSLTKAQQLSPDEIDQGEAAVADACDRIVEQIVSLFRDAPALASGATLIAVTYASEPGKEDAPFSPIELSTTHTYASQITLTFRRVD